MNEFEKAANEIDEQCRQADGNLRENCIEWVNGSDTITVGLSKNRYWSKVKKMAEAYPDDVKIVYESEDNIVAHLPLKALKLSIITKPMTEEKRQAARERLTEYWKNKGINKGNNV